MKYSLMFSMIFYICGCFYMIFGAYAMVANANSKVNRLFLAMVSSMAVWSFSYALSNSAQTAEKSAFWRSFSSFGWGVFYSFLLHFVLYLTNTESRLNKRIKLATIYLPAAVNFILFSPFGFLADRQYKMEQSDFGWVNNIPLDIWEVWFIVYYAVFLTASVALLIRWWIKIEPESPLKRQVTNFLLAALIPILFGVATETVPAMLGINSFPKLAIVFMMAPITALYLATRRFGLLLEKEKKSAFIVEISQTQNRDRTRTFETASATYIVGAVLTFIVGHVGLKKSLTDELFIAVFLLFIGLLTRLIPVITKNHTVQNTLFMVVSTFGVLLFMLSSINRGALTVWSVYIIFLLFTVILDSRAHALVFTALMAVIQIFFWIIRPKVSVSLNSGEYVVRFFIIILTFFTVRYLAREYDSKIQGFSRFAREQQVLEKVSSSFISVDIENAKVKIDEMFEAAHEILKFDYAYLFEFDADYKYMTMLNIYAKDTLQGTGIRTGIGIKSSYFHPGIKIKSSDFPILNPLINHNTPIICEDSKKIPVDEYENQRDFFISREINSFLALPITIDDKLGGMIVVEYSNLSNLISLEGHLYFIKMLANILGDTKKKTLSEERLYNFAYFDEATKLANKNMLKKKLNQRINDNKSAEIAVLNIELDNLRVINDTFGHAVGEQVVIRSATILNSQLEECCDIARIGEAKFAVVLPNEKSREQIEECAKRLLDSFSVPILPGTGVEALYVVAGIGISVYPHDGKNADTLLKNADLAGYQAKGTNSRIVFYTDKLESDIAENALFTNRLFRALENNEFSLEFQPQISCKTGKTVGVEALLRWTTVDNKRIPPDKFIPILEKTGLIYDVGLWVLDQTLKEHSRLISKGFKPLRVSVNLSVVQFQSEDFISDITKVIKESGVKPEYIELEITESLFSKNPVDVVKKLHDLKELGVYIAIDDFGSGYSSLNRLKLVPFDRLKIDKAIIDYIDLDERSAPITEVAIILSRAFNASVTAEGVETIEQAEFLKSLYCDEIQGYYYSRPLSQQALEEFLKKESEQTSDGCSL
ncbi:MAG: EAL domain-containing protein [Ruminococcaceae bacterium]|nr:EAL domain-containing protein [Oscillospiraceae bacterium]